MTMDVGFGVGLLEKMAMEAYQFTIKRRLHMLRLINVL